MQDIFKLSVDWARPSFTIATTWWLLGPILLGALVFVLVKWRYSRQNRYELDSVTVEISLPGGKISGVLKPDRSQRKAAWELYVELITRVSVVELHANEGLLREALSSLHSLFDTTRRILRQYGPEVSRPRDGNAVSVGYVSVAVLNQGLRPVLAKWHPLLSAYEAQKPQGVSAYEHERVWSHSGELRTILSELRKGLTQYAKALEQAAGVPSTLIIDRTSQP